MPYQTGKHINKIQLVRKTFIVKRLIVFYARNYFTKCVFNVLNLQHFELVIFLHINEKNPKCHKSCNPTKMRFHFIIMADS